MRLDNSNEIGKRNSSFETVKLTLKREINKNYFIRRQRLLNIQNKTYVHIFGTIARSK